MLLSTRKYHHHIGVNIWNGIGAPKPADNSVGLESFTLTLSDEAALQKAVTNLERIGAPILAENGKRITNDPSGNRIVLTV